MAITLSPETETRLRQRAAQSGQDPDSLADALLADALSEEGHIVTPHEAAQLQAGIQRGLQASDEGRVIPLSQAAAQARQRHGFPPSWAEQTDAAG